MEITQPGQRDTTSGLESQNALILVADSRADFFALRGLCLRLLRNVPPSYAAIWEEISHHKDLMAEWIKLGETTKNEEWEKELSDLADSAAKQPQSPPREAAFALATVLEVRRNEAADARSGNSALRLGEDVRLPLFFAAAVPSFEDIGYAEVHFREATAALVLRPGSRFVGASVEFAFRVAGWAVGILARTVAPSVAAEDIRKRLRDARVTKSHCPLISLADDPPASAFANKQGVLIFLHGLMSTDLGTFDGFIERWLDPPPSCLPAMPRYGTRRLNDKTLPAVARQAIAESVALVGWSHDTLCGIENNAQDLLLLIERHLGKLDCSIAFVCHSRGGLLARATAEKLFGRDLAGTMNWAKRICCAITFGTPHDGAELAEHPDVMLGSVLLAGNGTKSIFGMTDALAYLKQREIVEGIRDLRPRNAPDSYLRELFERELSKATAPAERRLCVATVAGRYDGAAGGESLGRRLARSYVSTYLRGTEHDLVVTCASAMAADSTGNSLGKTPCDHFTYFTHEQSERGHVDKAIERLWQCFGLAAAIDKIIPEITDAVGGIERNPTSVTIGGITLPIKG